MSRERWRAFLSKREQAEHAMYDKACAAEGWSIPSGLLDSPSGHDSPSGPWLLGPGGASGLKGPRCSRWGGWCYLWGRLPSWHTMFFEKYFKKFPKNFTKNFSRNLFLNFSEKYPILARG
jgi:hypothetical protein